jgi:hypothetical protein
MWYDIIGTLKPTVAQWTDAWQHLKDLALEDLTVSDSTVNDVTTAKHGLCPKLDGNSTHFLRSDGLQAVPAGTGIGLGGVTGAVDGAILLADGGGNGGQCILCSRTITNSGSFTSAAGAGGLGYAATTPQPARNGEAGTAGSLYLAVI